MTFDAIEIAAVGACSPAGANRVQLAMLSRARLASTRRLVLSGSGVVDVGVALGLPDALIGGPRLIALASAALREAHGSAWTDPAVIGDRASHAGSRDPVAAALAGDLPLVLGLAPLPDGADVAAEDAAVITAIRRESGVPLDRMRSRVVRGGRACFAAVMASALDLLHAGRHAVLAGAADARTSAAQLAALDAQKPKGPRATPSEGAAFVLLVRGRPTKASAPLRGLARVVAVEARTEPDGPVKKARGAETMIAAVRGATALLAGSPIAWILCDTDGTSRRAREWSRAAAALLGQHGRDDRPLETLGDAGAASGALLVAIASALWEVGAARGDVAVVALRDEGPGRAAILLEAGDAPPMVEPARPSPLPMIPTCRSALERIRHLPAGELGREFCAGADDLWRMLGEIAMSDPADEAQVEALAGAAASADALRARVAESGADDDRRTARELSAIAEALAASREALLDRIVRAQSRREPKVEPPRSAPPMRASSGAPRVHSLPTRGLRPFGLLYQRSSAGPPSDGTPSAALPAPPEIRERFVRIAFDAMSEMGRVAWLRRPAPGGRWTPAVAEFEDRILTMLDALVSIGAVQPAPIDVAVEVLRYTNESLTDPARAFVRSFVLGCLEGDDGLRAARMALRPSHTCTMSAHVDALTLASSSGALAAIEELCLDDDPVMVSLALEVAAARGAVRITSAAPLLLHADGAVRANAARAVGACAERDLAVELLERSLVEELEPAVERATVQALIGLDARSALDHARRRLEVLSRGDDPTHGAAPGERGATAAYFIHLLAVVGAASDAELVLRVSRDAASLPELGWLGQVSAVDVLIRALEGKLQAPDAAVARVPIGEALQRITGAHTDAAGEPRRHGLPTTTLIDARAWRQFWTARGQDFSVGQRYRFGAPYTVEASIDELSLDGVAVATRDDCWLELAAVVGAARAPRLAGWSARQAEHLGAIREFMQTKEGRRLHSAGQWIAAQVGRRHS